MKFQTKYTEEHFAFLRKCVVVCEGVRELTALFQAQFPDVDTDYLRIRAICNKHKINVSRPKTTRINKKELEYIKTNGPLYSVKELQELFNKTFNKDVSHMFIWQTLTRNGIPFKIELNYSEEEREFIKNNLSLTYKELALQFNLRFNKSVNHKTLKAYVRSKNLEKPKGRGKRLSYTVGNNRKYPIGSELLRNDSGFIYVKVNDTSDHQGINFLRPPDWKLKHHLIYEQHYGPIPKGHDVVFLNNNKQDFDISNLRLIPRRVRLIVSKDINYDISHCLFKNTLIDYYEVQDNIKRWHTAK